MFPSFGSTVKIVSTEETRKLNLADLEGQVFEETTPSKMDFEIIGELKEDFAVNVHFNSLDRAHWFTEELIEVLDNGTGTTMSLDGLETVFTKNEDGGWNESKPPIPEKWWEFWK